MEKLKNINVKKVINILLIIWFVMLGAHLVLYTLKFTKSLLNSDSCFFVDYSLQSIKEHTLFPKNWVNTNDFWVYSLIPNIIIFIKMGFSLFMSRQLACLVQSLLFLLLLYYFCKKFYKNNISKFIVFSLFLSGVSGAFMFEMFGDATYGTIVFFMLIALYLFTSYLENYKKRYLISLFIFLSIIISFSMRFPIFIVAPLIIYLGIDLYNNGYKKQNLYLFIALILATMVGFGINQLLMHLLTFTVNTDRQLLNSSQELYDGLSKIGFNYLTLSGTTNVNTFSLTMNRYNSIINSSSPLMALMLVKYIFALVTISLPFVLKKYFSKMDLQEKVLYIYTSSLTFLILFFLIIGRMSEWYRYITPVLAFLILLYPLLFKYVFNNKLKDRIIFIGYIVITSLVSLFLVMNSYYNFQEGYTYKNDYQEITDFLESKDLHFGLVIRYAEHNLYNTLSNGNVRITRVTSDLKPYLWLNDKSWFKESDYDEKTFFMLDTTIFPSFDFKTEVVKEYKFDKYIIYVFDNYNDLMKNINFEDF